MFLSINAYISFFPDDFVMITVNERKDGFTRRKIMWFVTTNYKSYSSIIVVWITNYFSYYQQHPSSIFHSIWWFFSLSKVQVYQWVVFEAPLFLKYEIRVKRYSMIIMRLSVLMSISLAVGNQGATGKQKTLMIC